MKAVKALEDNPLLYLAALAATHKASEYVLRRALLASFVKTESALQYEKEYNILSPLFIRGDGEPRTEDEYDAVDKLMRLNNYGIKLFFEQYLSYQNNQTFYETSATLISIGLPVAATFALFGRRTFSVLDKPTAALLAMYAAFQMYLLVGAYSGKPATPMTLDELLEQPFLKREQHAPVLTDVSECEALLREKDIDVTNKDKMRKSYLRWAVKNHPDKGGDTETFQQVTNCRDVLMAQ